MILMQLPPTGLQKAENILCPYVVIRLQRSHYDTALKRGVSFPHRHFHTGLRQMRIKKTANDSCLFRCIKHAQAVTLLVRAACIPKPKNIGSSFEVPVNAYYEAVA